MGQWLTEAKTFQQAQCESWNLFISFIILLNQEINHKKKAMGFLMGSSCFVQPSVSYPLFPSSSYRSIFLYSSPKNSSEPKRKGTVPMASMSQDESSYRVPLQRRTILFVGISVLPFFQLRARALEGLALSKLEISSAIYIWEYIYMLVYV